MRTDRVPRYDSAPPTPPGLVVYHINPLLIFLVSFGMVAVCLCFVVLMPAMGNLMAALWTNAMAEQGMAKMAGRESHTTLRDPNQA